MSTRPYRDGSNPRLWLVLAAGSLPYAGEEYVCCALTTSDLPANNAVGDAWKIGANPEKTSSCSPWVPGTVKRRAVANSQGRVTDAFVDEMAEHAADFLRK